MINQEERPQIPMTIDPSAVSVPFLIELQHIYWRVALGLNGAEKTADADLELPSEFNFKPAADVPASLERSKNEFKNWLITNGLRDCAEALQAHFDITFSQCLLMKYASDTGIISSEVYVGEYARKRKNFHKLDIHQKLGELEKEFGIVFHSETLKCFRSLNRVRNCLSHRGGFVQKIDCNNGDELKTEWISLVPIKPDGSEIELGKRLDCTEVWARKDIRVRVFQMGTYIDFTTRDFAEFLMNYMFLAKETAEHAVNYARATGILSN